MRQTLFLLLLLTLLQSTTGCYRAKPATVPLRTVAFETGTSYAKCLVVFLPGRGDGPEEFARNGFPAALKKAGSQCSMIGVDSHLGYFTERTIVTRLHEDVIAPARARNEDVWLVGISLGGLGGLLYTREHPGDVWGLITLAPYLGEDEVTGEVTRAGGLARWSPRTPPGETDFRRLWLFLKGYEKPDPALPPLWLGYGRGDKLAAADGLLAKVLPANHVLLTDGGHQWSTWTKLWSQFLAGDTVPGRRIAGVTPR